MKDVRYIEGDDLWYALDDTPQPWRESVEHFVAEIPGANDELSWWWVLRTKEGYYKLVSAWCDYTGWGCQSGLEDHGSFATAEDAARAAPASERYSKRQIMAQLLAQSQGDQPFGTYEGQA